MGVLAKLNKVLDIGCKLLILVAALGLALLPVPFLLGHEVLEVQPYSAALDKHQSRANQLEILSGQSVSNLYVRADSRGNRQDLKETIELGNYVCYWLAEKGEAVVHKYLSPKQKKKKGITFDSFQVEIVTTLQEEPPLQELKDSISKYIDFESEALENKRWVLVTPTELDKEMVKELKAILKDNPGYRFIVVSPAPLNHEIFGKSKRGSSQEGEKKVEVAEEKADEGVQEKEGKEEAAREEGTDSKSKEEAKKKKEKKVKVKKVKVQPQKNETKEDL